MVVPAHRALMHRMLQLANRHPSAVPLTTGHCLDVLVLMTAH